MITEVDGKQGEELLVRIVAMLTRMMGPADHVRECAAVYEYGRDGKAENGIRPKKYDSYYGAIRPEMLAKYRDNWKLLSKRLSWGV